ncbi:MAG: hypothetical protein QMD78_04075 [Methanocellales archaeon]|nr:hypothetical protein [Methanocellales archaeon]
MGETEFIRKNVSILKQTQEKINDLKKWGVVASDSEAIRRGIDLLHDARIQSMKREKEAQEG